MIYTRRIFAGLALAIALAGGTVAVVNTTGAPPPPPPPPPPPVAVCTTADATGCSALAGRTITVTNPTGGGDGAAFWRCNQNLLSETVPQGVVTGTGYPVKVRFVFEAGQLNNQNGVALDPGCTGDGDRSTMDLVIEMQGDGATRGFQIDAMKVRTSLDPPGGIQITGSIQSGPPAPGDTHQDGIQLQGGANLDFYDMEFCGVWATQTTTCQGAGGGIFLSAASGFTAANMTFTRVRAMGCHWGFNSNDAYPQSGSITNSKFRGGDPAGVPTLCDNPDRGCGGQSPVDTVLNGLGAYTKAPLYTMTNVVCDQYPYNPVYN